MYLCIRYPALGNLKISFQCARWCYLCIRYPALGNLKTSFQCARWCYLCKRYSALDNYHLNKKEVLLWQN